MPPPEHPGQQLPSRTVPCGVPPIWQYGPKKPPKFWVALSDLDDDAYDFLWLKPLCMLLIIGAAHIMVDRPFRQYARQALRERGPGWRSLPTIVVESINLDEVERQRAIGVSLLTAPRRDRLRVCEPAEPESLTRP